MSKFNPFYDSNLYKLIKNYLYIKDICLSSSCCKHMNDKTYHNYTKLLYDYQKPHFFKIIHHLQFNNSYIDTSLMGSGKTSVTTTVAKYLYFKQDFEYFVVIYPKNGVLVWKQFYDMCFKTKTKVKYCGISYDMFRKDNKFVDYNEKTEEYKTTNKWKKYCNKGVFLVFDEAYKLKNKTNQNHVANILLNDLYKTKSKVAFLGGATICDKTDQIPRFCKLFNIITKNKLARYDIHDGYILTGMMELLDFCYKKCGMHRYDYETYIEDLSRMTCNRNNKFNTTIENIYKNYILKKFEFTMKPQPKSVLLIQHNIYYKVSEEKELLLSDKLNKISKRVRYNGDNVDLKQINWGELTNELKDLEVTKIKTFMVDVIRAQLLLNKKVVIMLTYKDGIRHLVDRLEKFNPLVINGDVNSMEERKRRIDSFNKSDDHNLLICNIRVASSSISLDDQKGNKPRIMFILPTYCLMDSMQAQFRIYRAQTKSDAEIIYPYFYSAKENKSFRKEENILTGIAKKSLFMKKMTSDTLQTLKYPNEFPIKIQNT